MGRDYELAVADYGQSILRCLEFSRDKPDAPLVKFWCASEYRKRALAYADRGHVKTARENDQRADRMLAEAVAAARGPKEGLPADRIEKELAQVKTAAKDL